MARRDCCCATSALIGECKGQPSPSDLRLGILKYTCQCCIQEAGPIHSDAVPKQEVVNLRSKKDSYLTWRLRTYRPITSIGAVIVFGGMHAFSSQAW